MAIPRKDCVRKAVRRSLRGVALYYTYHFIIRGEFCQEERLIRFFGFSGSEKIGKRR